MISTSVVVASIPRRRMAALLSSAYLAPVLLFGLAACSLTPINYRLTLDVEVDGVVHTGSSVIETDWTYNPKWLQGVLNPIVGSARGDAVIVDLGQHGLLFALLTGVPQFDRGTGAVFYDIDAQEILGSFNFFGRDGMLPESLEALSRRRDIVEVPFSRLPRLVRFRDIIDPLSVEQVDPDNLAANFGPGVKLVRASLAITSDPITRGIQDKLPWLKGLTGGLNGKEISSRGLAGSLGVLNFKR